MKLVNWLVTFYKTIPSQLSFKARVIRKFLVVALPASLLFELVRKPYADFSVESVLRHSAFLTFVGVCVDYVLLQFIEDKQSSYEVNGGPDSRT